MPCSMAIKNAGQPFGIDMGRQVAFGLRALEALDQRLLDDLRRSDDFVADRLRPRRRRQPS